MLFLGMLAPLHIVESTTKVTADAECVTLFKKLKFPRPNDTAREGNQEETLNSNNKTDNVPGGIRRTSQMRGGLKALLYDNQFFLSRFWSHQG